MGMAGSRPVTIIAAADGSALGNPGPAGWGWYVDEDHWACGGWAHGTNNMGELMAVLDLLQQTAHVEEDLHVYCDSTYVINTITKWMAGWKRKGWKKGDGKPVMNLDLIQALDAEMEARRASGRKVEFEWVKGHAGHELNEEADRLANAAALAHKEGAAPDGGPGWPGAGAHGEAPAAVREPDLFSDFEADPEPSDAERVIELERSLLSDEVREIRAAAAALLHPDWQGIDATGRVQSREEMLDEIAPLPRTSLDVVSLSEVGPDALLLVWRALADDGASSLRSSLWVRSGGDWRQLFHQATAEA
jgi:ribonuclease HI